MSKVTVAVLSVSLLLGCGEAGGGIFGGANKGVAINSFMGAQFGAKIDKKGVIHLQRPFRLYSDCEVFPDKFDRLYKVECYGCAELRGCKSPEEKKRRLVAEVQAIRLSPKLDEDLFLIAEVKGRYAELFLEAVGEVLGV